jgi:hypothetical protein
MHEVVFVLDINRTQVMFCVVECEIYSKSLYALYFTQCSLQTVQIKQKHKCNPFLRHTKKYVCTSCTKLLSNVQSQIV